MEMARGWLKLRVSDAMIATAVAALVLHSAIDPLYHPNGKPLLVLTLDIYPSFIFPFYCLFRLRRGGTITRTDCLAAVVMFLSVGGRIHSHMSNSEVWMLRRVAGVAVFRNPGPSLEVSIRLSVEW
jgi:hypothetical protein